MKVLIAAISAALASSAHAEVPDGDLNCKTTSICATNFSDHSMRCRGEDETLQVRKVSENEYSLRWEGALAYTAIRTERNGFAFYDVSERPDAFHILAIGRDMIGSYSIVMTLPPDDITANVHSSVLCVSEPNS